MSTVLNKFIKDTPKNSISEFKIGNRTKHYFDTNLEKSQFYDILQVYSKNVKFYHKKIISFKYYNNVLDIVNDKRFYYCLNNYILKDIEVGEKDILAVNYQKELLSSFDMPSIHSYHNNESIEEVSIELHKNICICFRIINNNVYQIYIIHSKKEECSDKFYSVILEILNNIHYLMNKENNNKNNNIEKYIQKT